MQEIQPIGKDAVHVCIDMQRLFAGETDWHTPSIPEILPNVIRLTQHCPERTVFTQFTTPERAEDARGHWQNYFRRWQSVTTSVMDPAIIDVIDELKVFVPPARIANKPT
ncbi:MAG: isochorismatase family protein, partial [Rhodospirillaceae bacterium]|nr:isochorismatase family protein [Rhodospirillaceae bacterium]